MRLPSADRDLVLLLFIPLTPSQLWDHDDADMDNDFDKAGRLVG